MQLIAFLVLGLAAFTTQDHDESLTMKNLKKLDRFPAIQSFVKHLYAHEIQGLPHGGGHGDRSDHHGHELNADGNQDQKEKSSSYTNIQNVNLIVKNNRASSPLDNIEHLKPILKSIKLNDLSEDAVARCGNGRCDDDDEYEDRNDKKYRNKAEESLNKILNNIKQGMMSNVNPVLPYWSEMRGNLVNNNYDDEQGYELRCGCNRMSQRNGEGKYNLRCGCNKKREKRNKGLYRSERLEDDQQYDLRCGCDRISEREAMNGNGQYNLRCGCSKRSSGRTDDKNQYDLRCGCDRVSQSNNGQYELRCGCSNSRSSQRQRPESNVLYDLRCGCNRISQNNDGQYELRCGCSNTRTYQREGAESNGQLDLRCGCSRTLSREGVGNNGQYYLRCGCSRSLPTEGIMEENNGQYDLRCGCNRSPQREGNSNGQYDLRCGCTNTNRREKNYGDLVEMQAPRYDNNVLTVNLDDLSDRQYGVTNGKSSLVNEIDEESPVSYPDTVYMGLDPNDKYFAKVDRAMKKKLNPQDMVSFYSDWKTETIDNLLSYVLRDTDDMNLSRLSPVQRRIVRNLRNTLPKLKYVDSKKLRNRLSSLLFGVESESNVLPHDEPTENIYVPRWTHDLLQSYSSDRKNMLRQPRETRFNLFPLSKKQKLRLQAIIQKQITANNNEAGNWRRSQNSVANYGVPFNMEVNGLGQVNP